MGYRRMTSSSNPTRNQSLALQCRPFSQMAEGTLAIKYRLFKMVKLIVTKGKSYRKEGIKVRTDLLSTMTEGL